MSNPETKVVLNVDLTLSQIIDMRKAYELVSKIQELYEASQSDEEASIDLDYLYNGLYCYSINLEFAKILAGKVRNDLETIKGFL